MGGVILTSEIVEVGVLPCMRCGKPHNARKVADAPKRWGDWSDPEDGHSYEAYSWATVGRAAVAEQGMPSLRALAKAAQR